LRIVYGAPAVPADLPQPIKLAANLSQYIFYVLMIGMPLIGWAMLSAASYPVVLFGSVHLPSILPLSPSLHTLLWHAHYLLAFAFFAFILMHVSAILFHKLIRNDGYSKPWRLRSHTAGRSDRDTGREQMTRSLLRPTSLEKRTSAAEAVKQACLYGTAEAVPFVESTPHPRKGSEGSQC
jgi:hypothetical protein